MPDNNLNIFITKILQPPDGPDPAAAQYLFTWEPFGTEFAGARRATLLYDHTHLTEAFTRLGLRDYLIRLDFELDAYGSYGNDFYVQPELIEKMFEALPVNA